MDGGLDVESTVTICQGKGKMLASIMGYAMRKHCPDGSKSFFNTEIKILSFSMFLSCRDLNKF